MSHWPNKVNQFVALCIRIDFDNLRAHCAFINEHLKGERSRFEQYAENATAGLDQEQKNGFYAWHDQEVCYIYDVFPSLQWMSAFMLSYGIFEKTLNEICQLTDKTACPSLSLNDIGGQGIERAKIYLSKVCGITEPFNTTEWQRIVELSKIRNVIAHMAGDMNLKKKMHKDVFVIARRDKTITIKSHDEYLNVASIELTAEFNANAIESLRSFLLSICKEHKD